MGTPFLGELRIVSFAFAPKGWALCDGQLLGIAQNQALFALLGTSYGGDGVRTFALPNLEGRVALHQGTSSASGSAYVVGEQGGEASVTLLNSEMPPHNHFLNATGSTATEKSGGVFAVPNVNPRMGHLYSPSSGGFANGSAIGQAGGSQAHSNMMPFLVVNWIIALAGIFPSRS